MAMWNPWRGCHKVSEGCTYCYIHVADQKKNINSDKIVRLNEFDKPVLRDKNGHYSIKSGTTVYVCFSSDFLLEEADKWRDECWEMIKERGDLLFIFLTKRIERFMDCIPSDWNDGYDNVIVGVSVENQKNVDDKLSILSQVPIKHKNIILQPLIENVNIEPYLNGIELVLVGGESGVDARPLDYQWVLQIRELCIKKHVDFEFRQTGSYLIKDGTTHKIHPWKQSSQAKKANINFYVHKDVT